MKFVVQLGIFLSLFEVGFCLTIVGPTVRPHFERGEAPTVVPSKYAQLIILSLSQLRSCYWIYKLKWKVRCIEMLFMISVTADGQWSGWLATSICTQSCDGGQQSFARDCDEPSPKFGGKACPESDAKVDSCNTQPCPGALFCSSSRFFSYFCTFRSTSVYFVNCRKSVPDVCEALVFLPSPPFSEFHRDFGG